MTFHEINDATYDWIKYIISGKVVLYMLSVIILQKIKVDLSDSLHLEKTIIFHVITLIKSVFNKDKNNYYYNIFLVKNFLWIT